MNKNYIHFSQFWKTAGLVLAVVVLVGLVAYFSVNQSKEASYNYQEDEQGTMQIPDENSQSLTESQPEVIDSSEQIQLPGKILLQIDFASQAPFGDWSEPYENACEEASIITVEHYLQKKSLSKEQMKAEIDASVEWQFKNWGGHADLDASKTLQLARENFKLNGQTFLVASTDDLKKQLASGHPVIIPTAGRKLGNPNFRGAGPEYHMLVLKGYDDMQGVFITNDPGTRKGENYIYKYDVIMNAISGPNEDMSKVVLTLE